jgi:flagellar hook assembly protein FlgD
VYDATGRRVRGLIDNTIDAGWHEVPWTGDTDSGRRAASGVYFCQLEANGYKKAVIMQLVR